MAEPASNGRPLGERLALAALGALSTSTSPAELRAMLGELSGRVRSDANSWASVRATPSRICIASSVS